MSWLKDFEPEHYIQLDGDEIRRLIGKLKPGVKPGIDKLRGEHLKQLIGRRIEPSASEGEFSELLSNIINIFLKGIEPLEVSSVLRDNELFAGPKGEDDVRPIAIGNTYRKLAAMAIMRVAQEDFNEQYFGNLQLAMKKNGMEEIIHTFALSLEMTPELSIMNIDGMNAFNMANRFAGLGTILEEFPQAFPSSSSSSLQNKRENTTARKFQAENKATKEMTI